MATFPDLSFLNPNINQPQVDPYQRLQEVIQGINNQPLPVAPEMGILERILTSIAQASAVVASPDPGTALSNQLKAKADSRNAVTKAIQDRQNLVNQATLQAGFQQAEGMAREQGEIRKEGRLFKQKAIEDIREVNLFKQKKQTEADIQLASNKSLLEQNEAFEAANEPARLRRKLNSAVVDLLPEKYKGAALWESNARLLVPNADLGMLRRIAEKEAGIDPDPLTDSEKILKSVVTKAQFDEAKKQRGLAEKKTLADITESDRRGRAALISANAQAQAAANQAYNDNVANWAKKRQVDILSTQYYKTPDGAIVSIDEVNKLPINAGKMTSLPLPPEANIAHQQKLIQQMNDTIQKSKFDTQAVNTQLQQGDQLNNLIQSELKTKTPEQVKQFILNSTLPQSEKDRGLQILGVKPPESKSVSKSKGGVQIIPGVSVPIGNPGSATIIPGVSFGSVGTALSEAMRGMLKKNTPEENLRLLEEQRKRGSFSEAGYKPSP